MARGHVNRIKRPDTWLRRPSLRREDFSCQPGAVHTWHFSDMARCPTWVRFQGQSGLYVLGASISPFDPMYGPAVRCKRFFVEVAVAVLHQCIRSLIGAGLLR